MYYPMLCVQLCELNVFAVAANIQKLLDGRESSSVTFALVSLRNCLLKITCPLFFYSSF